MKRVIGLIVCAVLFSGCFTSNVLVTIRPDGSGTVDQTTTIRPADILRFQTLASPDTPANVLNPAAVRDLRREFEKVAQGMRQTPHVRLRSSRPIETADTTGWQLIYDFSDMSALSLDLFPEIPGGHGFLAAKGDPFFSSRMAVTLEPIAGGLERYTFRFPGFAMDPSAEPPASWATGSADEMAALRKLMQGSRITIAVDSAAPIVRTNSPFRHENRVTLIDADIEQALFSKQIGMLATTPSSFDQLLTEFADLPGVTLAKEHVITIDVQNPSTDLSARPPVVATPTEDTEIYLAPLSSTGGTLTVGPPINISNNAGYDNQPSFTPDGNQILFTSSRGQAGPPRDGRAGAPATPATDIYRYSIGSHLMWRITNTPEGEFSPVMMADGKNISVVRVEPDGSQRLWRVGNSDNASGAWAVILPDIRPVGYYAWMDDRTVVVFVLGQNGQPSTLQVADTQTGQAHVVVSDIGRSIQRMPSGAVSFVHRERDSSDPAKTTLTLKRVVRSLASTAPRVETLIATPAGLAEPFVTWTPDGSALVAVASTLFQWREGAPTWTAVANLGAFGLRNVTRLAVSPKGDRIALVASPK